LPCQNTPYLIHKPLNQSRNHDRLQDLENELAKAQNNDENKPLFNLLENVQSNISEAICEIEQFSEEE